MKNVFRALSGIAAAFVLAFGITVGIAEQTLPDSFKVVQGQELDLQTFGFSAEPVMGDEVDVISMNQSSGEYDADVLLFNTIPIKTVHVDVTEPLKLVPCGTPFGIKMFTNGVVVVGMSDIDSESGKQNPATQAGLKIGDIITNINGETVYENEEVSQAIQNCNGEPLLLTVKRGTETIEIALNPVISSQDGSYKGGLWVRDSTAGIGTVTFYNPENGLFLQYLHAGKVPGAKNVEDVRAYYMAQVPMRKGTGPEDVTKAVLYLIEQTCETGQALPVTGGQVMLS